MGVSAKTAIASKYKNETNVWRLKEIIGDINIDKERKLVFYENFDNETMVSYLKKNWIGMWKVIETNGEIPKKDKYKNASLFGGKFNDIYIYGGCIYKNEVCKVNLCGNEAKVVHEGQRKFWYIANNEDVVKNDIELELFNSNGNIIELLKKDVK